MGSGGHVNIKGNGRVGLDAWGKSVSTSGVIGGGVFKGISGPADKNGYESDAKTRERNDEHDIQARGQA